MKAVHKELVLGSGLAILSAFGYAAYGLISKLLQEAHVSYAFITFWLFFICTVLSLPQALKKGVASLKTKHGGLMVSRAIFGLLAVVFLVGAVKYIPLVDAMMLNNTAPLFIPFISYFLLQERLFARIWLALILGLVGVILILHPNAGILNYPAVLALLSGISMAFSMVTVRKLVKTDPVPRILFYYFAISTLIMAFFLPHNWPSLPLPVWLLLLVGGIVMYVCIHLFSSSLKQITATTASILYYTTIVFSGLFDWLFWDKIPSWMTLLGIVCIMGGGVLSILFEKQARARKS